MRLRKCCITGTSDVFPEVVIQLKLPRLAYRELAKAANNFHPFKYLGRGRFAMVYHGKSLKGQGHNTNAQAHNFV